MSRVCFFCGKRVVSGRSIKRRGLAKKKGGVGRRITGVSKRVFYPNLHKVKAIVNGSTKVIKVCTTCIKSEKVKKAF
ncbi:MAG: 50S ribosomal protein L28 [Candidatus Omnitrophica bacterium]|nr:50S ribosomal protein L28 [Candidatus Omnitrophota bacterium]